MSKKKLCWVTADCFIDCDLKPEFMKLISMEYDIHWIIVFPLCDKRYEEQDFYSFKTECPNVNIEFFYQKFRRRNLKSFGDMRRLRKSILHNRPDLIYLNFPVGGDPYIIPLVYKLPVYKTIISAHQGRVHEGMQRKSFITFVRNLVYHRLHYVNMFSESQMKLFKRDFPKSVVFLNHLGLKELGKPSVVRDLNAEKIRFLSFGIIKYAKNIDLLIDAAEELYNLGEKDFIVSINGSCNNWSYYEARIKHQELFETDIRIVPNECIPDLFEKSHFFVQPYRVVSQSGPLKIAYYYNTPVIVSNLPGFTDEMAEGISGFIFERENLQSLTNTMRKAIECYRSNYQEMLNSMKEYVKEKYSEESMADNYKKMFKTVLEYVK